MKTSLLVDLALSLAQAGLFLGEFNVPEAVNVGLLSGESGRRTIAETARRIARSKNWGLRHFDKVTWEFKLPKLGVPGDMAALRRFILDHALEVVLIDPTYMAMGEIGEGASNLFVVGKLLFALTQLGEDTGCTPLLCHHTKQSSNRIYEAPDLEDIAWAGFQEWVRQWLLVGRREKYDRDRGGSHKLWLAAGGSAGHSGLWAVDIEEGTRQDPGGRRWEVDVQKASQARAQAAEEAEQVRTEREKRKDEAQRTMDRQRVLDALRLWPDDGETLTAIRGASRTWARCYGVLKALEAEGLVEQFETKKHTKSERFWRLVPGVPVDARGDARGARAPRAG